MENTQTSLIRNNLVKQIRSLSISKSDLKKLLEILQERNRSAGDIEISHFKQMDQTDEQFEQNKKTLKNGFELRITVNSKDGVELFGSIDDIFNSPNFPDDIGSIYVNSDTVLKANYNYSPGNHFSFFLDFNKPEPLNFSFLPSQATPNNSNISVVGFDATWAHGVFNEFDSFLKKHPSKLTWLHKHSIYDLLLWIVGFPFGFWACSQLSPLLNKVFGHFSSFVQSASYVYIFLASVFLFRILFHYTRWIWPLIEYQSPQNKAFKHRITLGTIILGLVSAIFYDIIKILF